MTSSNDRSEFDRITAFDDGGPLDFKSRSIWQMMTDGFNLNPDGPAFVALHQPADRLKELLSGTQDGSAAHVGDQERTHLSWTFRQLLKASEKVAAALQAQGIRPGSVFVCIVPNSIEYAVCYAAVSRIGCTFCSIDPTLLQRPDELRDVFNTIKPSVAIFSDRDEARKLDELYDGLQLKLMLNSEAELEAKNWRSFLPFILQHSNNGTRFDIAESELETTASHPVDIVFTSGTTGPAKATASFSDELSYSIHRMSQGMNIGVSDKLIVFTTNFRVICRNTMLLAWSRGCSVVFPAEKFDARLVLRAIMAERCTHLVLIPALLHAMARQADLVASIQKDSPLNLVGISGDIVVQDIIDKTFDVLRPRAVFSGWGMTEGTGAIMQGISKDTSNRNIELPTLGGGVVAIGKTQPGSKAKICKPNTRILVNKGDIGSLHLCSPGMVKRYLENRDADYFYDDDEGHWFITGDLAVMDEERNIFIMGRSKDIIKRKGVGLSPIVIENCINRHAGVESSVFSYPHTEYGEVPVAVLRTRDTDRGLKAALKEHSMRELGEDSQPHDILTLHDLGLDDFPLNATGKVMKRELRAAVQEYYGFSTF